MLHRLRPLRPYLARYRKRYVLGFVALLVTQAVGVTVPLIIKAGIDALASIDARGHRLAQAAASGSTIRHQLLVLAGVLLGVALTKAVFQFWMRWILIGISRDVEYDLRNDLFAHLSRLSQRFYVSTRTGDIMSKLTNDLNAVRNLVGPGIMYSASTVVVMLATISLMIHLDFRLTLLAVAPLPLASVLVKFFGQKIHDRFERIQAMYSDVTERVRENISGVRVIRAFCQEEAEMATFDQMNREFVEK